jgi:hypothetical protein
MEFKNIGKYLFKIRCNGRIKLAQDTMRKVMEEQKYTKRKELERRVKVVMISTIDH